MSTYVPSDPGVALGLAVGLLAAFALAFVTTRLRSLSLARALGWGSLGVATVVVHVTSRYEGAGVRMVTFIAFGLAALKGLVTVEAQATGTPRLTATEWWGFTLGWLGMQPRLFTTRRDEARQGGPRLLRMAAARIAAGLALLAVGHALFRATGSRGLATVLVLPGVSLVLHFGVCNVMAGAWRLAGVPCEPIFRAPLRSTSLKEFWGRRWNVAFSEMSALTVYRPLMPVVGQGPARALAFVVSGALHEMAISLPVQGGYGLPTLYFLLHGGLVTLEEALARRGRPVGGWGGRLWALTWLVVPMPVLFHRAFLDTLILPLAGIPRP